jgi:hypothetical protein
MNKLIVLPLSILFGLSSCITEENENIEIESDLPRNKILEDTLITNETKKDTVSTIKKRKFTIPNAEIFSLKSNYTAKEYDIYIKLQEP